MLYTGEVLWYHLCRGIVSATGKILEKIKIGGCFLEFVDYNIVSSILDGAAKNLGEKLRKKVSCFYDLDRLACPLLFKHTY
jgi:hypothetical protein